MHQHIKRFLNKPNQVYFNIYNNKKKCGWYKHKHDANTAPKTQIMITMRIAILYDSQIQRLLDTKQVSNTLRV